MTRLFLPFIVMILLAAVAIPGMADVDPILLDEPSPIVFECGEDLFLEIPYSATIEYSLNGRRAEVYYLYFDAELLFLGESPWSGVDKSSYVLKHTDSDGNEKLFPLNYMMTNYMSMGNNWKTMADTLSFATLVPLRLVFSVDIGSGQGWSLLFRPAERGGSAVCEVEIPIRVR